MARCQKEKKSLVGLYADSKERSKLRRLVDYYGLKTESGMFRFWINQDYKKIFSSDVTKRTFKKLENP